MPKVRVTPGLRGLDAVQVSKSVLVTKTWTEVSSAVAKKLVGLEYKGRPKFEFEDDQADNAESEAAEPSE